MQLIITEKPSVARAIAEALDISNEEKNGYIEGKGRLISWCLGHLIELAPPQRYGEQYKVWSYETLPIIPQKWEYDVKPETEARFDVLMGLVNRDDVTEVVNACDSGREGELIFRLVYEKAKCRKEIKRLWISSMEEAAIRKGFEELKTGREMENLYKAAICRQEADWLVGMNGTRLFTVLYNKVIKVGRVMTPTLAMVVNRDEEIGSFKKTPFYTVKVKAGDLEASSVHYNDQETAETVSSLCDGQDAYIKDIVKEEKSVKPPLLYDLTALQRDANNMFSFTAKQTLDYTQELYEKKLCTYPRTDSRYLTEDMADPVKEVITLASGLISETDRRETDPDISRIIDNSKVTDHHAIIPTVEIRDLDPYSLPGGERKILMLLCLRLICAVSGEYRYKHIKVTVNCSGHLFEAVGKEITDPGWKEYLDSFKEKNKKPSDDEDDKEKPLPFLTENMELGKVKTKVVEGFTKPQPYYTEATLLSAMEKAGAAEGEVERKGLGTPATRADIIEKLVTEGYIKREAKKLKATDDGVKLITIMPETIRSEKMTAEWEHALSMVAKGQLDADDFMEGIITMVHELVGFYHGIGEEQREMFSSMFEPLGKCPKCGGDVIKGKFGAYCKNKCGMNLGKAFGKSLNESNVKSLLEGKKILLKKLKNKEGREYDAYLTPDGIEEYTCEKNGIEVKRSRFRFKVEFPERKDKEAKYG